MENNKDIIRMIIEIIVFIVVFFISLFSRKIEEFKPQQAIAPAVIAALVSAGAGLATAGVNAAVNRSQWREQNEYNAPAEQMSRYRAAGLNPNLIYGTGSASAGNAGAITPFQATPVSTNDLLQAANAVSVIKNTDANARKAQAEAIGTELNNLLHATQLRYYGTSLEYENKLKKANIDFMMGRTGQLGYQNKVLEAQAEKYLQDAAFTRDNRELFQPALVGVARQNAATAANRLNWDKNVFNPLNILHRNQSILTGEEATMAGYMRQKWPENYLLQRRGYALRSIVGGAGTLLGFGRLGGSIFGSYYGY